MLHGMGLFALPFPFVHAAMFHLLQVDNPYMEHLRYDMAYIIHTYTHYHKIRGTAFQPWLWPFFKTFWDLLHFSWAEKSWIDFVNCGYVNWSNMLRFLPSKTSGHLLSPAQSHDRHVERRCEETRCSEIYLQIHSERSCFLFTLPETNIAPETLGLEDEFPFGMANFQVLS